MPQDQTQISKENTAV